LEDALQTVSFQWFARLGLFSGTLRDLPNTVALSFLAWTRTAFPPGTAFPDTEPMMIWYTPDQTSLRFCYPQRLAHVARYHFVRRLLTIRPLTETYDSYVQQFPRLATALPHQRHTYYTDLQVRPYEFTNFLAATNALTLRYRSHSLIGFLLHEQREQFPTPSVNTFYGLAALRADWDLVVLAPSRRPMLGSILEHLYLWMQTDRIDRVMALFRFPTAEQSRLQHLLRYESQVRYVCEEVAELCDVEEERQRVRRFRFFDAPRRLAVFYDQLEHSLADALADGVLTADEYATAMARQTQLAASIGAAVTSGRFAEWATTFCDPITGAPVTDQTLRVAPRSSLSASASASPAQTDTNRNLTPNKRS
jgi:hypothetical protein